ncbi:MAG: sporulation protein, partial [Lawsonibacter sp.]|nr:sporulation protein [Lawsonibacter sp.]
RFYKPSQGPGRGRTARVQFEAVSFPAAFARSVTGSLTSCLNICAFVLLFTVVLRLLALSGALDLLAGGLCALLAPLGLTDVWARKLLTGFLEISSGVSSLTGEGTLSGRLSMAAFILGWAGLSVHCQVLSFLEHSGLSMKTYFVGKLLHGGISAVLAAGLARCLPWNSPCPPTWPSRWTGSPSWSFHGLCSFRRGPPGDFG